MDGTREGFAGQEILEWKLLALIDEQMLGEQIIDTLLVWTPETTDEIYTM